MSTRPVKHSTRHKTWQFSTMLNTELMAANASKMRQLVQAVLDKAIIEKDMIAIKYIIDRIEGPVSQKIQLSNDPTAPFNAVLLSSEALLQKLTEPRNGEKVIEHEPLVIEQEIENEDEND
jgi:hypothetical protein